MEFTWPTVEGENGSLLISGAPDIPGDVLYDVPLEIPSYINGRPVTGITTKELAKLPVKTLILPDTLVELTPFCFAGSQFLSEIQINGPINCIPKSCFHACMHLKKVFIQNHTIEDLDNSDISSPSGSQPLYIDNDAFAHCIILEQIALNNVLLGTNAFFGSGLKKVLLRYTPNIVRNAFGSCASLKELDIRGTVKIDAFAFATCFSLTDVHVSDTLHFASTFSFVNCSKLKTIHLHHVHNPKRMKSQFKGIPHLEYVIDEP